MREHYKLVLATRRWIAVAIYLGFGALAGPAAADDFPHISPGIAYVAHAFDGKWDAGIGTEVSYTSLSHLSEGDGFFAPGAFVQFEWYGDSRYRLGLGGQVSGIVGVELGMSIRFEEDEVIPGLQLGPYYSIAVMHIAGRLLLENDYGFSLGTSIYLKPLPAIAFLTAGRPS